MSNNGQLLRIYAVRRCRFAISIAMWLIAPDDRWRQRSWWHCWCVARANFSFVFFCGFVSRLLSPVLLGSTFEWARNLCTHTQKTTRHWRNKHAPAAQHSTLTTKFDKIINIVAAKFAKCHHCAWLRPHSPDGSMKFMITCCYNVGSAHYEALRLTFPTRLIGELLLRSRPAMRDAAVIKVLSTVKTPENAADCMRSGFGTPEMRPLSNVSYSNCRAYSRGNRTFGRMRFG